MSRILTLDEASRAPSRPNPNLRAQIGEDGELRVYETRGSNAMDDAIRRLMDEEWKTFAPTVDDLVLPDPDSGQYVENGGKPSNFMASLESMAGSGSFPRAMTFEEILESAPEAPR